jgi:hypothetical protein
MATKTEPTTHTTPKASVSYDGRLVTITIFENSEIELEDIKSINSLKNQLVGANRYKVLFIAPQYGYISNAARAFSSTPKVYANAIAKAIVAQQLGVRIVGNFFVKVNKPPAPTKVFSNVEKALSWLASVKQ